MTAQAGALSHTTVDWHAINWETVNHHVRRLQARIVKAAREGKWGKVKALQHLLTHSFSGKALAVRRVTENQGKHTPGVDHETWNTPVQKAAAIRALRSRGYQPRPLRRVYIPKPNGQRRPLGIPTMLDRAMQALYLLALDPIAETLQDANSYGFRRERSTADAIEQCFKLLARRNSASWILEGDIQSCFDRISHEWLLAHTPINHTVLQRWLKAGFMEQGVPDIQPTDAGTPQGGIISPVLANLALNGLEQELRAPFTKAKTSRNAKVHLVRYADDFIITGDSKELLEREVKPRVEVFLRQRGLALSPTKTSITPITDGFDFLGQTIRRYRNGKLLIIPSKCSVKAFLDKVRAIVKANRTATVGNLITQLNPVVRGWTNYHRHVVSGRTFSHVQHAIFQALWRWAKRRHPNKSAAWVKQKYFKATRSRQWVFAGTVEGRNGQPQKFYLCDASRVSIKRHIKVKAEANPYDPTWELYFEQRLDAAMGKELEGRAASLTLWQAQDGRCPTCQQKITPQTGWHSHHIVWRVYGGSDEADNRVLLHPNCHRQVHSRHLSVVKPGHVSG